jgi:hypothetical protein
VNDLLAIDSWRRAFPGQTVGEIADRLGTEERGRLYAIFSQLVADKAA